MRRKDEKKPIWGVIVGLATVITAAYFILNACEKQTLEHSNGEVNSELKVFSANRFPFINHCGEMVYKGIYFENNDRVGSAYFFNDGVYLYAHVAARPGYAFHDIYLFAGEWRDLPLQPNGSPDVKSFTLINRNNDDPEARRLKIPLSKLPANFSVSMMIQVNPSTPTPHNNRIRHEQAWVDGKVYGTGNYGHFFNYQRQVCKETQETGLPE